MFVGFQYTLLNISLFWDTRFVISAVEMVNDAWCLFFCCRPDRWLKPEVYSEMWFSWNLIPKKFARNFVLPGNSGQKAHSCMCTLLISSWYQKSEVVTRQKSEKVKNNNNKYKYKQTKSSSETTCQLIGNHFKMSEMHTKKSENNK